MRVCAYNALYMSLSKMDTQIALYNVQTRTHIHGLKKKENASPLLILKTAINFYFMGPVAK